MSSKSLFVRREQKAEQLIELVRQNSVLYDAKHPRYNDTKYKQSIWDTIGAYMDEDSSACKARWINIRDNYRRSLRNACTRRGDKKARQYKFTDLLGFLNPYFDHGDFFERSLEGRADLQLVTSEDSETGQPDEYGDLLDVVLKAESAEAVSMAGVPFPGHPAGSGSSKQQLPRRPKRPLFKRSATQSLVSSRVMDYLVGKLETAESPHPVDAFLGGLSPSLKNLNPYYLSLAKSEIFATIQKYEQKMLLNATTTVPIFVPHSVPHGQHPPPPPM